MHIKQRAPTAAPGRCVRTPWPQSWKLSSLFAYWAIWTFEPLGVRAGIGLGAFTAYKSPRSDRGEREKEAYHLWRRLQPEPDQIQKNQGNCSIVPSHRAAGWGGGGVPVAQMQKEGGVFTPVEGRCAASLQGLRADTHTHTVWTL